jgi:hypothetical protein
VPGPENLTLDELVDAVDRVTGVHGRRQHLPGPMLRLARLATRVPNPVLSAQIATAIVMNGHDMAVDGPAVRAAFPSIPMTTAADVARALFAPQDAGTRAGLAPAGIR